MENSSKKSLWIITQEQHSECLSKLYPIMHDDSYKVGTYVDDNKANVTRILTSLNYAKDKCASNAIIVIIISADDLPRNRMAIFKWSKTSDNACCLIGIPGNVTQIEKNDVKDTYDNTGFEYIITKQRLPSFLYKIALIQGKHNKAIIPDTKSMIQASLSGYLMTSYKFTLTRKSSDTEIKYILGKNPACSKKIRNSKWAFIRITHNDISIDDLESIGELFTGFFNPRTKASLFLSRDICCSSDVLGLDLILFLHPNPNEIWLKSIN